MKTCYTCKNKKNVNCYSVDRSRSGGRRYQCKECEKEYRGDKPIIRTDNLRKYHRDYNKKYTKTEKRKKYFKEYIKNRYSKVRLDAMRTVYYAVKIGYLVKKVCEVCENKNVHAHHKDYLKPLEVIWLCPQCHAKTHRLEKKCYQKK